MEKITEMLGPSIWASCCFNRYLTYAIIFLLGTALPVGSSHALAGGNQTSSSSSTNFLAPFNKITEEMVLRQPDWNPSLPLPKTIQELSKIVVDAYTPLPTQPHTGWVLQSITFFHVPRSMWHGIQNTKDELLSDKWYCRIYISAFGDHKGEWWKNQAEANVFLDGTIIQSPTAIK